MSHLNDSLMIMMMMMTMMIILSCFCSMIVQCVLGLISSLGHCQMLPSSQTFDTLLTELKVAHNLSSGSFQWLSLHCGAVITGWFARLPLRKKYPYSEFFWSAISRIWREYGVILRIPFMQCSYFKSIYWPTSLKK